MMSCAYFESLTCLEIIIRDGVFVMHINSSTHSLLP